MAPYPEWLHILAWVYITICLACALGLAIHTLSKPQKMWIMGLVWPITALYMGLLLCICTGRVWDARRKPHASRFQWTPK